MTPTDVLPTRTGFLATQTAIERAAIRLTARPEVRAAVGDAARRWQSGTPGFRPEAYARLPESLDEVLLLLALQVVNSDPRRPQVVEISAGPHVWGGLDVPGGRWGINNPDTLYFAVPLEAGSRYVLHGRRQSGEPLDLNISVQIADVWVVLDSIGRADLVSDPDGGFTVVVGGEPGADANHVPIRDGGTVLLIRQTLADWAHDLPYELSVERTDGPDPAPVRTEDELARLLIGRLREAIEHSLRTLQPLVFDLPVNTIPTPGEPGDKPGFLVAQRSTLGHFRLDDDGALVLVVTPGGAGYTAIAATDIWGVTTDSAAHGNSLNQHQAVLDPDGRITAVVALRDPGVSNWIDPGGLREGILMLRWQLLGHHADATGEPGVTVRAIDLTDLSGLLSTAPRADPARRADQVAARAAAYSRRFTER